MFVKTLLTKSWGVDDLLLIISIVGSHSYRSLLHALFLLSNFSLDTLYYNLYMFGACGKVRRWEICHRHSNWKYPPSTLFLVAMRVGISRK
jgi:hypothetical protein